eukprot:354212-Chlamydomonas_euryale.AAC.14
MSAAQNANRPHAGLPPSHEVESGTERSGAERYRAVQSMRRCGAGFHVASAEAHALACRLAAVVSRDGGRVLAGGCFGEGGGGSMLTLARDDACCRALCKRCLLADLTAALHCPRPGSVARRLAPIPHD